MATMQRNDAGNGNQTQPQPSRSAGTSMQRNPQEPMAPRSSSSRSPFGIMRRLMEDMDRMFWDFGGSGLGPSARETLWMPEVELLEKNGSLVVRADLPGMKPEDVRVDVDRGVLTISGERKQETKEEKEGYFHSERSYGSFHRRIALPDDADPDKIEARFENGVLEVTIPTPTPTSRAKSINVKSGR
jgi:HSP20 family protein